MEKEISEKNETKICKNIGTKPKFRNKNVKVNSVDKKQDKIKLQKKKWM